MSRKTLTAVSVAVTILGIMYLGFEYNKIDVDTHLLSSFMAMYLDTPQKYIFNGMIYGIPVIFAASVPCGCPEIRIRLGNDIFKSVLCRCTGTSSGVGAFVFLLYMITAGIFGVEFDFSIRMLGILLKLVIFYMGCSLFYELFYFLSGSPVGSIAAVVGVNFMFLAVMLMCNAVFHLSDQQMLSAFVIYECMETVVSIMLLHFAVRKKECM